MRTKKERNKALAEARQLRSQLRDMLSKPLMMRGVSAKYLTGRNTVGLIDQLVGGTGTSTSRMPFCEAALISRSVLFNRSRSITRSRNFDCFGRSRQAYTGSPREAKTEEGQKVRRRHQGGKSEESASGEGGRGRLILVKGRVLISCNTALSLLVLVVSATSRAAY